MKTPIHCILPFICIPKSVLLFLKIWFLLCSSWHFHYVLMTLDFYFIYHRLADFKEFVKSLLSQDQEYPVLLNILLLLRRAIFFSISQVTEKISSIFNTASKIRKEYKIIKKRLFLILRTWKFITKRCNASWKRLSKVGNELGPSHTEI